tara:strand:+ start:6458 stop:8332 length:1875 start_codon:yes stop_codon:yes gene_type:complete
MKLLQYFRENLWCRRTLGFLWHLVGIVLCYAAAFQIRFDFDVPAEFYPSVLDTLPIAIFSFLASIVIFRLYVGLWMFFSFRDCLTTALAFAVGSLALAVLIYLTRSFSFEGFPRSVLVINYLLILGWEVGGRSIVRIIREWRVTSARGKGKDRRNIAIIGAPEEADALIRSMAKQSSDFGRLVCIITEAKKHKGGEIHGVPIRCGVENAGAIVSDLGISMLLFLPPFTAPRYFKEVMKSVSEHKAKCEYRVIPSIDDITSGRVDVTSIRRVAIEDLLHRKPYEIDNERMRNSIEGKSILVTGAGGSIGSEICRQVLRLRPRALVLFEISEYNLFQIEREFASSDEAAETSIIGVVGDVRKSNDMRGAIRQASGVDTIYHAAAYKHVGLMERNPATCFQNNVGGTHVAATIAAEESVGQFVLISSDKAVRPTSLMGASKRLAERSIIERPKGETEYKAVRFGNVLGSSGSVVPIFKDQIKKGGPVTVTSAKVTRYFMTIPEAVELVLAAGSVGEDREILVLEMGDPVKIDSLAKRMIELSGFVPGEDIKIEYVGLKKGEKEFEELLTDGEDVVRTENDRIWVVEKSDSEISDWDIEAVLKTIDAGVGEDIRLLAHEHISGSLLMD